MTSCLAMQFGLLLLLLAVPFMNGVCLAEYVFGQSLVMSGPQGSIGAEYRDGILAAFSETNRGGGVNGHMLRLASRDDQYNASLVPNNMQLLLQQEPGMLAYVGSAGAAPTVAAATIAKQYRIPLIGAYAGAAATRTTFNEYVINVRAGYNDEALAMLKLLVETKRLKRIAMVYQNDSFGIPAFEVVRATMASLKLSLSASMAYDGATVASQDWSRHARELWDAGRPQGVILFAVYTAAIPLMKALSEITAEPIIYTCGTFVGDMMLSYFSANPVDFAQYRSRYYQTQVLPPIDSATSRAAARYRAAMTMYDGRSKYTYVSFEGYVLGRFVVEALRVMNVATPSGMRSAIYKMRMIDVDELLIGPLSSSCPVNESSSTLSRSSLCNCTQGLRCVSVTSVLPSLVFAQESVFEYPITSCFASAETISRPVVYAAVTTANSNTTVNAVNVLASAISLSSSSKAHVEVSTIDSRLPLNETRARIDAIGNSTLLLAAIGGMFVDPQVSYPVFPLFIQPAQPASAFARSKIYLLSTMQQEMFVIAKHLAQVANATSIHLLYRRTYMAQGIDIIRAVSDSLESFGRSLDSMQSFYDVASLKSGLSSAPAGGAVLVVGIVDDAEGAALASWVAVAEGASVFLAFMDVMLYWSLLSPLCSNSSARCAVHFATSLPNWMDPLSSEFVKAYHNAIPEGMRLHPLSAVGYLMARFADTVVSWNEGDTMTSDALLAALYHMTVVSLDDFVLGPFIDTQCTDSDCLCNVGPRMLRMFSIADILTGAAPKTTLNFGHCHVEYKLHGAKGNSVAVVVSVSIVVPLVVLAAAAIGFYFYASEKRRNNSCAPKDASSPFAVIFTDIQSSTALWGRYPSVMATAIDTHHAIIRGCIAKHGMYEVKTIGDSFMIVTKSADAALRCALDIQRQLYEHDWGTKAIDELYTQVQAVKKGSIRVDASKHRPSSEGQKSEGACPPPPTLGGDSVTYDDNWNGLRVRIGVQFGKGTVEYNEVSLGYDYSGGVVSEASRVEAVGHGGQIVVPAEFLEAASGVDGRLFVSMPLGEQTLRGLDHPLTLMQVLPASLSGRTFPPLRLDAIPKEDDAEKVGDRLSLLGRHSAKAKAYDANSSHETSSEHSCTSSFDSVAAELASKHSLVLAGLTSIDDMRQELISFKCVIEGLFSSSSAAYRLTTLQELCALWRVHSRSLANSANCDLALLRVASRIAETTPVLEVARTAPPPAAREASAL